MMQKLGVESFERTYLIDFFRACAKFYSDYHERRKPIVGQRYFVKKFINGLDLALIEWLLDELTKELSCLCGKEPSECDCRNGISKIMGSMLDRYFELAKAPFEPSQIWKWIGNLKFYEGKDADKSKSVEVLRKDDQLRQGIIDHVFGNLTDFNEISEAERNKFGINSHSGLSLGKNDYRFLADLAFDTDNINLWTYFIAWHSYYQNKEERKPNDLRRYMRAQALEKPSFMREWAKHKRITAQEFKARNIRLRVRYNQRMRRRKSKEEKIRLENIKYIQDNKYLVERGCYWWFLAYFADVNLSCPDKIEHYFGDKDLVLNALRNCLEFISPHVPDLLKLAELKCASMRVSSERILYAACLEIMRFKGNLEGVELCLLRALRTYLHMHYSAVSQEERVMLETEVDRLIFPDDASVENFLRQYLEPQLTQTGCEYPELWLLNSDGPLSRLRPALSIEWLKRFRELAPGALEMLFEIAAQYGNQDKLKEIIAERCADFMVCWPILTEDKDVEKQRNFWLLRAWYYLDDPPEVYWNWLKVNREIIFLIYERSERRNHRDYSYWPKLTPRKVEAILDAFIDKWPKVALPNHWGTGSPKGETAYRFLKEVIWFINSDDPDKDIPVLNRLLADSRFIDLHPDLKNIYSSQLRKRALRNFEPPTPQDVVNLLDHDAVVTVEGLRQIAVQELLDYQKALDGGEFNSADRFYEKGERLGEVKSTEIIAERLNLRLEPQGILVTPEHQLKGAKRSDFTLTKMIGGKRRLLVVEVKGQWHGELYTAASAQLHERYSIHPDAEQQGIFLAIWFGEEEEVAGTKKHNIANAEELKISIEKRLPQELVGLIDVFVLDVSKPKNIKNT